MTTTTKLALELLANNAANQTLANTTFAQLNQIVQAGVVDKDLATPPGSPANEALYIVATGGTGAWSGKDGQLTYWLTSTNAWQFIVPREGMFVHVNDEDVFYKNTGSAWEEFSSGASLPVVQTFTGNKTLALSDINTYNVSQDGTAQTVTVPAQSTVTWTADAEIHIEQGGAGAVTVTGATGVIVNGVSAGSFTLSGQFAVATLKRKGSDSWTLIFGSLDSDLQALADNSTNGLWARTGTGTGAARTITGTANKVTVTNGDGVSGNPTLTIPDVVTLVTPTVTGLLTVSGGQIAFPSTQVPSANANTLDDYEEGTWTPVLTFATPGDLSVAYSTQAGSYTKVGRQVMLSFFVVTSTFTHTTASGEIRLTGVPFTAAATLRGVSAMAMGGITKASYTQFSPSVRGGENFVVIAASGSGVVSTHVNAPDTPSGTAQAMAASLSYNV